MLQEAYRVQAKLVAMLAGGTLAFAVGLLDDVFGRRFPVVAKFAGQVLAAVVLVVGGIRTDVLHFDVLNVALTLVWVVGITNAFNLLDNMDGLSAGVAFVASLVLLVNAWLLGEFFISLVLVAFMGSLLGFLVYNWHPASIFLGDCGSLFIGFTLAALTLLERYVSHASSTLFPVLMPVLVLALPILDTTTVTFIRVREGRPIYVGDSRHLSHRLVSLGMRPPLAVFTIYVITLGVGLGAVGLAHADLVHALLILVQALAVVAVVLILLFYERRARPRREGS
jgi:UDP-GlcNAc:undecaprenyl-phosphate GlcNAc-1-phosphate transferase